MKLAHWFEPPRVVLTLFVGLMSVCALALGWLGWQVVVQDRVVEAQRQQQELEIAADRAVAAVERAFANSDAEVTVTAAREVEITPSSRLAYPPTEPIPAPLRGNTFSEAEALEFGGHDLSKAAEIYAHLAESGNTQVRGEALVHLGRALRHEKKWPEALQAYKSLEKLDKTMVAGMPAGLVARGARCSALLESGQTAEARREAAALWSDLIGGRWRIGKATLETYMNELRAVAPDLELPKDWEDRMNLAAATQWALTSKRQVGGPHPSLLEAAVHKSYRSPGSEKTESGKPGSSGRHPGRFYGPV